jgi:hypothetical protein
MRQEYFIQYPQRMFGLPDLPVRDARPFPQVSQKGFNILSGPIFQRFVLKKTIEILGPPHIEGRTVRSHPILLRAPPVEPRGQARGTSDNVPLKGDIPAKSCCIHPRLRPWSRVVGIGFPKKITLSGIVDIHDFHPGSPFYFKGLSKDQVLHAMQNYHITI